MKFEEVEACSFSRDGFEPFVKSPVIWGHKGNILFPLCYLKKPKSVPAEEWEKFLDGFTFQLKRLNKSE